MVFTKIAQFAATLMILGGCALLALATSKRLMIIGGVMIIAALHLWHDRRVTRHHCREARREARYVDIVRDTAERTSRPREVTCLPRASARASRR